VIVRFVDFVGIVDTQLSSVRRPISEVQRWQIISMHTTGMSFKAIERKMGYHYTVRKHTQNNNVKDLPVP
jgi:hypothetical protein